MAAGAMVAVKGEATAEAKVAVMAVAKVVGVTAVTTLLAVTNPWHGWIYSEGTMVPPGTDRVFYAHGPAFYGIIGTLYLFVAATLVSLWRGFARARRSAWSLLVSPGVRMPSTRRVKRLAQAS